jgi:subtilisin-like proprotein convertase family protein
MKYFYNKLIILFLFFTIQFLSVSAQESNDLWTKKRALMQESSLILEKHSTPNEFKVFDLNIALLKKSLNNIPKRKSKLKNSNVILHFPNGEGELEKYEIFEASILEESLQKKYPNIKSYIGVGVENPSSSIRFSITDLGLNAMVLQNSKETAFIETYTQNKESYLVYKKSNLPTATEPFECKFEEIKSNITGANSNTSSKANNANDGQLRTFRLAIATTGEYSQFHLTQQGIDPTATDEVKKSAVLSAIVTTMTRVNAIFERDVALTMVLVANNADIIFLDEQTDGFTNDDAEQLINESQTVIDANIGLNNYDIGHTFSTGGGGLAQLYSPCTSNKARGITGSSEPTGPSYDIDYVAHEMGHQFGAHHTFNSESGGCNGNKSYGTAVEPGSGSTIMGYSGLCAPNNVESLSDDYFHLVSIREMWANISAGNSTCGAILLTENNAPIIEPLENYSIPVSTPFALTANASDSKNDLLTYTWEQLNNETTTYPLVSTATAGPAFRSLKPSTKSTRYFPDIRTVLSVNTANQWEVVPSVARTMKFGVNVRDNNNKVGQTASKETTITFVEDQGAFYITSQGTKETWDAGTSNLVTWEVAGTNLEPINCSKVDILLSTDGGFTYPITLASNINNNGSYEVISPNIITNTARIKVASVGNIFYAINATNISIESSEFIMNFESYSNDVCAPNNASYTFTYNTFLDFNKETTFSASGFPESALVTFIPTSATTNDTAVQMIISGIENGSIGSYNINVEGTSESISKVTKTILNVYSNQLSQPLLVFPDNNSDNHLNPLNLKWEKDSNKLQYEVEIALDVSFSTIIESSITINENYTPNLLENSTTYFWRVKGVNNCGESDFSEVFTFTTATINCESIESADIPQSIPDNNPAGISSILTITKNKKITDLNVTLTITHEWVGDLTLALISPKGTSVILSKNNGDEGLGYTNTTFNDEAENSIGIGIAPFTAEFIPQGNLSDFNFEESYGEWILKAVDSGPEDIGTIDNWSLEICGADIISNDNDKDGILNSEDICPNTPLNSTVDSTGCPIFTLPAANFSIKTVGETCPDKNNGQIEITTQETHNYIATIDGNEISFTDSIVIPNLAPNNYEVCITIEGEDDFKQCYSAEILEGITVSGKANSNSNSISIKIEKGTAPFIIYVNNKIALETFSPIFNIDVKHGDLVQVKTSVSCEGVFSKTIDLFNEIIAYPNPTKGNFEIVLPISQKKIKIDVYNIQSQLISAQEYDVISGKVQLNINNKATGLYFIKVYLDNPVLLKIIKD